MGVFFVFILEVGVIWLGEWVGELFFMCPLICKQVRFCGGIYLKEGFEYITKKNKNPKTGECGAGFWGL